jgi:hypothetical protein
LQFENFSGWKKDDLRPETVREWITLSRLVAEQLPLVLSFYWNSVTRNYVHIGLGREIAKFTDG